MKVNNKINKRILLLLALYFKSTSAAPNLAVVDEWWSVDQQVLTKELGMDEVRLKLLDVDHIQIRHMNQTDSKNLHSLCCKVYIEYKYLYACVLPTYSNNGST